MPDDQHQGRWWIDLVAILALLVAVNLITASDVNGWVNTLVLVGAAGIAVAAALVRGYSLTQLGLAAEDVPSGLRYGAIGAVIVAVGVAVAALIPFSREFFEDARFEDATAAEITFEAAFRIPFVTALGEELLFRAVLLAILLAGTTVGRAVMASSALFGLWHILTTLGDIDGNEVSSDFSAGATAASAAGIVVVTGVAGAIFAWFRLRSRSVIAPWLVHSAINISAYLAGALVVGDGPL